VQAKFVTKDGNTIQVEGNAHGYLLNGKVMETHGIFHDITGRKIAQEALAQAIERESSVSLLASKLVSSASIEDISELVLESARRITCSAFGFVGYIDSETGYLVTPTLSREIWESCQVKDKSIVFKKFQGLWGWVLNNRQSLLTNAPSSDSRSIGIPPGHIAINNFLSAPAMTDRELVGQVALANSSRSYDEQDFAFVERLATLYAVAVQRIRMENTISRLAYHDSLTGLPNRTLFNDRVTMAISRANRYRQRIALMLLDMDRFKDINDTLGHDAGDQLLRDFSNRMVSILRKTDTVSRIGGDEFLILLPEVIDAEYVDIVAQKILEAARKPYMFHDREVMVTVSIGIAIYPEDGEDVDILIKHADSDMYQVKEQGRNNYQRYAPRMSTLTQQLQ
jgi:diguanylate cyclase (GGDEF)-like protein